MMSLWDALRMNMMISYQELVRTFLRVVTIFATELVAIFNQAGKLSQYIESGSRRV
ncbi:hypothetical protein [Escherichia coli]|uniref:hypothetical protein n=1 Tax=Escherichia coli TaxID=562 RepID=UPI001E4DFEAA|nr:hypothetical protein [Escherichia coli]